MATYDYWNGTAWVEIPKVISDTSGPSATNLVLDPYFADLQAWTFTGTPTHSISLLESPPTETPSWVITANGTAATVSNANVDLGRLSKIVPLATYRFTAWIKSTITRTGAASGITINGDWIRSDGTILGMPWSYQVATVAGTWVSIEFVVAAPSTATYVSFMLTLGTGVPSGTVIDFSYPCIQPMITSNLLADDSVGSSKIYAKAVTVGKIDSNAIVSENIQSGAIIADKIAAGAVTADAILAGSINATKLTLGFGAGLDLTGNPIQNSVQSLNDQVATINNTVVIDSSGVTIKNNNPTSPQQVTISNNRLSFYANSVEVAYIDSQYSKMFITQAEITSNLKVGVHQIEKYNSDITLVRWAG